MDLQFQKKPMSFIRQLAHECKNEELTQEVRLPDDMPDISRVICTWGQMVIRGKEWRQDRVNVSGGIMVWILYEPVGEEQNKVVESWIPFSTKVDISGAQRDGTITAIGSICYQDARSISARKMMLRIGMSMNIQAHCSCDAEVYEPPELDGHIQIKWSEYPVRIPSEIGEKPFNMEDKLPEPESEIKKILRYSAVPQILETKVLGKRLVFRGSATVRMLYEEQNGNIVSYKADVPFSQLAELDYDYEEGTESAVQPVVTNVELTLGDDKMPLLKLGIAAQYIIYDQKTIRVVDDAYSTINETKLHYDKLQLPIISNQGDQIIRAEASVDIPAESVIDCDFTIAPCICDSDNRIEGHFYVLFIDREGSLQCAHIKWEHPNSDEDCINKWTQITLENNAYAKAGMALTANTELKLCSQAVASEGIDMVTGIELCDSDVQSDEPSLILIRAGEEDLWTLAKKHKSSIDRICNTNGITQAPDDNRVLIIPVV